MNGHETEIETEHCFGSGLSDWAFWSFSLVWSAEDTNCSLDQATLLYLPLLPSNKSLYMEGEVRHVLRALRNLGLKRHFFYLKMKQSTSYFIGGCDAVVS